MSAIFLVVALFICLALGIPVAISLGLASISTILLFADQSMLSLAQRFFHTMQIYPLLAVPFFILAATFMTTGGVAKRMIDFANALVGHWRGGLAMAALLACAFFSAVSGSAPATVVAVGSVMIGGMIGSGYTPRFASGVICNAGTLGILIPPSLVMVIYGAVTESSIGNLFIAGMLPGVILTLAMMATVAVIARRQNLPRQPKVDMRSVLLAGRKAFWGLVLLVIILGGIYAGIFTPTEAAAVSAVYAFPGGGIHLQGHQDQGRAGRPHRGGEDHGHADVHHRQCLPFRLRAHHRADSPGRVRVDRQSRAAGVGIPDRGQRAAADLRQLHGTHFRGADPDADHLSHRHAIGHPTPFTWAS